MSFASLRCTIFDLAHLGLPANLHRVTYPLEIHRLIVKCRLDNAPQACHRDLNQDKDVNRQSTPLGGQTALGIYPNHTVNRATAVG